MNTSTSLGPFSFDDFLKTPTTASGNDGSEWVVWSTECSELTVAVLCSVSIIQLGPSHTARHSQSSFPVS